MLIKIYKIEYVQPEGKTPFWAIETNHGNMSAFDKDIVHALDDAWKANEEIEVDAKESKDGKYVNIRKLGTTSDPRPYDTPEKQRRYQDASEQYAEMHQVPETHQETPMKLDGQAVTVQKPQDLGKPQTNEEWRDKNVDAYIKSKVFNPTSMYVSYAKDIFCALMQRPDEVSAADKMKLAINLVKQAHEAFS